MAEVSIIVPVYQVEKYIRQCVDSILAQTFTDFELILVDDGSKDQSGHICDEYAKKDQRVKVIHQKNSGAATARNSGMDKATGSYFTFIDGDDYIAPTMLECLHKTIVDEDADIAACNYLYFFEDDEKKNFSTNHPLEVLSGAEIFYDRKNDRNYGFWTVVWNKLYKSEIFKQVKFRHGKYYEDEFWANDIYQMDIRIVTIPKCLYYYRQHDNSTMRIKNIRKNFDVIEAFQERIYVYLQEQQYSDQAYKVLIYTLEYLEESKRLITSTGEKKSFILAEKKTKDIVQQLKKKKLSKIKRFSLLFIGINPCLVFGAGIKFRGTLEKLL